MELKRVGIIGCGWVFENRHVVGYIATKLGYIQAFCDVNKDLAEKARNLYFEGIKKRVSIATSAEEKELCEKALQSEIFTDAAEMIPQVDMIDICTPPKYHLQYAQMAADAGKPILCEKPIARSWLDAKDLLDSLKSVPFYIFTQGAYHPFMKLGKEIIDSGKLGEIISTRNCATGMDMDHVAERPTFWDPLVSGGGCLFDIGPHVFAVMRYWLGPKFHLKSVKDNGIARTMPTRTIAGKPNTPIVVEDIGKVEVEWEDDDGHIVKSELESYWGHKIPGASFFGNIFGLYHEVEGTKATLIFPTGTIGLLAGKKPLFGLFGGFIIKYKDGRVENQRVINPPNFTEIKILIDEFLAGAESRTPEWFGEDMIVLLNSAYLSKKRDHTVITPEEFKEYADQFGSGAEGAELMIKDLFDLS